MKQIFYLATLAVIFSSCSMKKQASTTIGRTDEVYFTVNDTRKKSVDLPPSEYERQQSLQDAENQNSASNAGNYGNSYSNRFRNFGSSQRFSYNNYQPALIPTMSYNPYTGWSMGMSYVDPRLGFSGGFNSPFSPYYGCNMPYYDPFYTYGWGGSWMTGYYPFYTYNPYLFNGYPYGYNPYYNPYDGYGYGYGRGSFYNNYNNYGNYGNSNSGGQTQKANYSRRTGSSNNQPSSGSSTTQPQNSSTNSGNNNNSGNSGNKWYNSGNSDRGGSSSSGSGSYGNGGSGRSSSGNSGSGSSGGSSSGGNSDRGSSGSGGSTRRR